jgi:hypothetical protein
MRQYKPSDTQSLLPVWQFPGSNPYRHSQFHLLRLPATDQSRLLEELLLGTAVLTYDDMVAQRRSNGGTFSLDPISYEASRNHAICYGSPDHGGTDYDAPSYEINGHGAPSHGTTSHSAITDFHLNGYKSLRPIAQPRILTLAQILPSIHLHRAPQDRSAASNRRHPQGRITTRSNRIDSLNNVTLKVRAHVKIVL